MDEGMPEHPNPITPGQGPGTSLPHSFFAVLTRQVQCPHTSLLQPPTILSVFSSSVLNLTSTQPQVAQCCAQGLHKALGQG